MEEILKKADLLEGQIAILGFGNGTYPNYILDLMSKEKIVRRDFLILDKLDKRPPQPAFDFRHKVPNQLKKKCNLVRNNYTSIKDLGKVSIFFIDKNSQKELVSTLKYYSKYFTAPCHIIVNNYSDNVLADTVVSFTNKKDTSSVVSVENFSYFSIRNKTFSSNVKRTRSVLT